MAQLDATSKFREPQRNNLACSRFVEVLHSPVKAICSTRETAACKYAHVYVHVLWGSVHVHVHVLWGSIHIHVGCY